MRYLSVCSGIEAASVAWHPLGWEPLAFSEIEAFPRAVLAHHYPDVPLHGDFTKLRDQAWIADADVLVGGTPCQAFSVAGLRNSLADDRGNLTLEFVRLADAIDAARSAAGRERGIVVWENVPGVLSTKDNAFGAFLAGLAGEDTALIPTGGRWTDAGVVDGPSRRIAWRTLDAQFFGLAQRRRRVFVVASAREGVDPAAVLLEFEGVRRDSPPRREAGQGFTHSIAPSLTSSGRGVERGGVTRGQDPVVACMASTGDISHCLNAGGMGRQDYETETLVTHALRAEGFDASEDGTGRGTPLVPVAFQSLDHGADATENLSPTLRRHDPMAVAIPVQEVGKRTGTSTTDPRAGIGIGEDGDPMYTLQAGAQHGVAVEPYTLAIRGRGDTHNLEARQDGLANALLTPNCGRAGIGVGAVAAGMAVRRLTPVECSRLQGFPDDYLLSVTWRGKCPPPDGPMYRALGNSMAVPVMRWICTRIAAELARTQSQEQAA